MPDLPTGTVTFLFTDIEGSTRLWEQHPQAMPAALARHDALLRQAIEAHGGHVFKTMGDQFCAVFAAAPEAVTAAVAAQRALCAEEWREVGSLRVRMALNSGAVEHRRGDYFGSPLNRVARLLAAGHGGQVLLSQATADRVREALPSELRLRDLGAHRLKDLQQPEHLFQLLAPDLPSDFPPLRSLEAFAHNLPAQLTSFIGREQAMAAVKQLLATTRLLTLTGSGGCGKTRLALQVAAELLEEYAEGVWLVELAPLADPDLVPQTVASALGVREQPGRPLTETLVDSLRPKSLLLVLDNCEHLLTASAQLADTLLRGCPRLRILASSREGLAIGGEQTYRVPSLALPDVRRLPPVEQLQAFEAVQLFTDRARLSQATFAVTPQNAAAVAQVCQRLDGIPLAIELAAARVKVLAAEQIADRLDDKFRLLTGGSRTALPRQQTLRALIDWSYDLLAEPERTLFRRLSVFAGGWALAAAETVCAGDGIEEREVLDRLTGLVDKSLVVAEEQGGEVRYRLLEMVRQYARDRLWESGEGEVLHIQHRDFFLALAERADLELVGPDQAQWLERLKAEHSNARAALEWCTLHPENTDIGLRLAAGLIHYWDVHGHYTEGSSWLERLLRNSGYASPPAYARGLWAAGTLAWLQGDNNRAIELARQSLALAQEMGDKSVVARSLDRLGSVTYVQGDVASARMLAEESLSIYRELGDRQGVARLVHFLGVLSLREGNGTQAEAFFEESQAMNRQQGNWQRIALNNYCMALVAQGRGEHRVADAYLRDSVAMAQGLGYQRILVVCVEGFAAGAAAGGRNKQAARLLGAAGHAREEMHLPPQPNEGASVAHSLAAARTALGEETFAAAWAAGQAMTLEQAIHCALEENDEATD